MRHLHPLSLLVLAAAGCGAPVLTRDGQLVFPEAGGARGATVLTASGVQFMDDASEIPRPVIRRSVDEPWRPATGFLLPADGIFRKTSTPLPVQGPGLAVVLRASDALVPSWGGEVLLRLDALVPAAAFPGAATRPALRLALVLDGLGAETAPLAQAALDGVGGADRVGIVAAAPLAPVLPLLPGSDRTLLGAAVERLVASRGERGGARDLPRALAVARGWLTARSADGTELRHVLVLSDGSGVARGGEALAREVRALAAAGVRVTAVGAGALRAAALAPLGDDVHPDGTLEERVEAVEEAVPPPGDVVLEDVELQLGSVPAPARLLEVSGGAAALALDIDRFFLGDLVAGEARTEVARLSVPPWVPGEPLELTLTASYRVAATGERQTAEATLRCRYTDSVTQLANNRHGDVIAYASGLAMVRRLHRAFLGSALDSLGGLRPLVALQSRSLAVMAVDQHDPALRRQAEVLSTLLGVLPD